jgi:DNA repair exonuclease SbcCD ATPase subunit
MGALEALIVEATKPLLERISALEARLKAFEGASPEALSAELDDRAKTLVASMLKIDAKADQTERQLAQVNTSLIERIEVNAKGLKRVEDVQAAIGGRVDNLDLQLRRLGPSRELMHPNRYEEAPSEKLKLVNSPKGKCPTCGAKAKVLYRKGSMQVCEACSPN